MARKKLPPDIQRRLEACRALYKSLRHWHHAQIQKADRAWMLEAGDLIDAPLAIQARRMDALQLRLNALTAATPADALAGEPERNENGN